MPLGFKGYGRVSVRITSERQLFLESSYGFSTADRAVEDPQKMMGTPELTDYRKCPSYNFS